MKSVEELKKIRNMDAKKLNLELEKEVYELSSLKLSVAAKKEDNTSAVSKKRKKIARINTILNQPTGVKND